MNATEKRARGQIVRLLDEALSTEKAMERELSGQIAMTAAGPYRTAIERHLRETRGQSDRIEDRLDELDGRPGLVDNGRRLAEVTFSQAVAMARMPLELIRGSSAEEKVLKNARDAAASEAREIALYRSMADFAERAGDRKTARLAREICDQEERMLDRVLGEIDGLTGQVFDAEVRGESHYDIGTTGAAETVQAVRATVMEAGGGNGDLPIRDYDSLNASEITGRLRGLSQSELEQLDRCERTHQDRATIRERIASMRQSEPFPGYDEMNAGDIVERLREADEPTTSSVARYERAHKNRSTVLQVTGPAG